MANHFSRFTVEAADGLESERLEVGAEEPALAD